MANRSASFIQQHRDRGAQMVEAAGQSYLTRRTGELRRAQTDFNNYLNSGNYSTDNNKKYRDMATQAVADLDAEMKRYGKSSNEYKTLDSYKNYYQNALPTFDRLDVTANAKDYLSYDPKTYKYQNWHSEDDYNTQKSYLDDKRKSLQAEMDELGETESDNYKALKSWMDQYDELAEAIEDRNRYDRQFETPESYAAYERSRDYNNNVQTLKQKDELQAQLAAAEETYNRLRPKFYGITDLGAITPKEQKEYEDMLNAQQTIAKLKPEVIKITGDLAGMEKYQGDEARANFYLEHGVNGNVQEYVDSLKEAREKAEDLHGKYSTEWAKIDLQIRALAGENEDGTNENKLYDESTPLGRYIMSNFDSDEAEAEIARIDKELEALGAPSSTVTGRLTDKLGWIAGIGASQSNATYFNPTARTASQTIGEATALENDPRVMDLRAQKAQWQQKINSSDRLKERNRIDNAFEELKDKEALAEEGAGLILQEGKGALGHTTYQKPGAEAGENGDLGRYFSYLNDEALAGTDWEDMASNIRDKIYAAIAAENKGLDIGYTVDDVLKAYEGNMAAIAAHLDAKKINDTEGRLGRFLKQEGFLLSGGAWNNLTHVGDMFTDEIKPANRLENMQANVLQNMGEYGGLGGLKVSDDRNLAQAIGEATWTTGNMLPSIAASYLMSGGLRALGAGATAAKTAGRVAGASMMGLTSGGQAYQQALAEGWSKEDAGLYGTIIGAAEVGTQYAIGGITGLGGITEDKLLAMCKGIDHVLPRVIAETGIHIGSEVAEELVQNRIERYLQYDLFREGNEDWMSWTDDDWYTVVVTALSTGAMEGPGTAYSLAMQNRTGKALSGAIIPGKGITRRQQANNAITRAVGEMMQGNEPLSFTLVSIGTDLTEVGSEANEMATKMAEGKLPKNAMNLGELYGLTMAEFQKQDGKNGIDKFMNAMQGGATTYNGIEGAKSTRDAAKAEYERIKSENPDAVVLDQNATALRNLGINESDAVEYGALMNKILSGEKLTDTEADKVSADTRAGQAIRAALSNEIGEFDRTAAPEITKATITAVYNEMKLEKQRQQESLRVSVVQAAMNAAKQAEVNRATASTDFAKAQWASESQAYGAGSVLDKAVSKQSATIAPKRVGYHEATQKAVDSKTAQEMQAADQQVRNAERQVQLLEKMSFEEAAKYHFSGLEGVMGDMKTMQDLQTRLATLNEEAKKIRSVHMPSAEQRTRLNDINAERNQIIGQQMALMSKHAANLREGAEKIATEQAAKAQAEAAQNTSADTIIIPGTGARMSREGFVQNYMAKNPGATAEQANARFDQFAEQTGAVKKGTVGKAKPERAKLTGKVEYWNGGALEGTNYDQVSEAEARELLGDANMAFLEKVLTKVANVTLIKSRLENGKYVGANGIFYRDGRIYLDVNAEMDFGERGIVLAAAHELTHFIAEYNNPAFLKLKDFVLNELKSKGMPLDERIKDQQERYKAATGKELSREKAEEEIVADACEMMLTDADAIKRFAAENPTEAKTILDWLTDFFNEIADAFKDLVAVHPEAKALQDQTNKIREMWLNALVEADANAVKSSIDRLSEGGQKIVESLGSDTKIQVDANGDMALAQSEDGKTIAFSMKTYKDSGKQKLIQALKENGHTQEEIDAVVENIEATGEFLLKLAQQFSDSHGYNNLMNNLWAEITTNVKTGKQVISTLVNNGDYPVNMDLQLICKKRVAYMRMLTRLIDDGVFEKVDFKGSAIADLNAVLRDGGFETACLGCFVESRRLQLQAWAETIVEEWNAAVDKRNPQAGDFNFAKGGNALNNVEIAGLITELENAGKKNDKGNLNLGKGAVAEKMGRLLDKVPSLVQHLTVADLLTPQGMSTLRSYDQNLFSLVKQRYGANSPKIVQDFNAYNSEIADLSFKFVKDMIGESVKGSSQYTDQAKKTLKQRIGESKAAYNRRVETEAMRKYLYDIGGARIQSFSDFMIENVFDYMQIIADLSAREFPLHGYSKEAIFLRLFGMTGGKFNGSLIAHVEGKMGKEYAGLLPAEEAEDGRGILVEVDGEKYAICFDDYARHVATGSFIQSIGMKDIIALQLDPRYSKNVGSITIGVSDKQILAMLDSPYFRMVIPYHASGMIPEFAILVGVSNYNDYTDYQTTKVNKCFDLNGNPVEGFWKADGQRIDIDTHFDFNEAVQRLGDAKAAANEYLEWCKQRHPVYDGKKLVGYATFTPKFSDSPYGTDFTKHENYYKLLEDFNSYDSIGEASALQGAVTMTLPSEATRLTAEQMAEYKQALRDTGLFTEKDIEKYAEKADMTFQELIAEEVGNRAEYESRQAKVWDETVDKAEKMLLEKYRREPAAKTETLDNSIPSVEDVPTEAVVEESDGENAPSLSTRETDPATLKWLNEQVERGDYVTAYKTFLEVQNEDGTVSLYPPMASKQTDETGKRKMANSMAVGEWEKSVGNPNSKNIIEKNGKWYYRLIKDNGKTVDAAYDPYQHSSNVVLNDQFEEAYQRPGLVTYEVIIPKSELTEGYRYSAARDDGRVVEAALPVGEHPWKKGTVAGKLKNTDRTVYMTRWLMPSRRIDNSEVAQMYRDILAKEDSSVPVPFNVVPPGLLTELEKIGVPIDYEGSPMYKAAQKRKAEKAVIPAKTGLAGSENTGYNEPSFSSRGYARGENDAVDSYVDEYGKNAYNNRGWASAAGLLNSTAWGRWRTNLADVRRNNYYAYKNKTGETVVLSGTEQGIHNRLVYTKGGMGNPTITKVVEINALDNDTISQIEKEIRYAETSGWREAQRVNQFLADIGDIRVHSREDYLLADGYRKSRSVSGSGSQSDQGLQDGRGSSQNRGEDFGGDVSLSSRNAFQRDRAEVDAEYADAVAEDNEDWQKQLVAEAANLAGYTTHAYHGSPIRDITVFRTRSEVDKPQKMQLLFGTHFTTSKDFADLYARKAKNSKGTSRMTSTTGRTYGAYLDLGKSLDLRTANNYTPGSEMYSLYEDLPENIKKKAQPHEFSAYDTSQGLGEGKFITAGTIEDALERMTPKAATEFLVSHGYNSVLYDARYNTGSWDNNRFSRDPSIIMLDANRIKSDEPITYDSNGNVISLSERFNRESEDIRFSSRNTNKPDNLKDDLLNIIMNGTAEDVSRYVTEQMNAHEDAMENAKIRPPVIPSKGFVPKVTAQEKAALETRRKGLIQAKGAMRPSEKSNGFAMPKQDEKGNWFHRFLQNAGSTKELQAAQDQVEKFAFTDVAGTYTPDSNKADLNWAKRTISEDGMESAIKQFNRAAVAMDNSQYNITKNLALGQQLLIETSRQGDMQNFLDVLSSLTLLSGQAGKSLQAFRMLKKSGPIGELYYVQKAVKQLNERHAGKITAGKMQTITVPEDLANEVLMTTNEEEQDKAMDNLIAEIAKQVPATLMDKWNAWRYLAMLGNARTHIRNIIGNAVFVPLRFAKDFMAAGGELLATKVGLMDEADRRKALFVSRELRDFAKQDAQAMQKELQGTGKYNPAREILDARRILPGFLETLSRKNGDLLELEDWWFLSPAYQNALSQALAHTGYSLSEMLDGSNKDAVKALNNARRIAIEEAQKATYRDFNAAASMLNRIKRMESGKASDKVIGVLLEGILPFTKTPINILRRGVEYSPIGIASSIFEAAAGVKNGNLDMAQFIDHLSAGLSGTAVAVLGYLLASLGYIRNKKDDKEEDFDKLQGYQDYSVQIGNVSATIDWAAPTALPLFTGAAVYDMVRGGGDLEWRDAWDAMMMIAEPMMSLSMLEGLNSTLSAASYADDSQKLATVASSAFTSYIGQAFPTLFGQVARSIDGTRRSTYVDKNSPVPTAIQRFVQSSIQSKTPVWESQKIPYIDQWGREDTNDSKVLGALENFLSPSYINVVHTTDVDESLRELYDATKDSGVLPSTVSKYFSVAGERKDLTADEYVSYAKDVGSTKYQLLTSLFSDPRYMSLTDAQKAEAVSVIYKYATAAGKYHIDPNYDLHGQGKWIEEAEAAATDVQRFNRIWEYLEEHFKK